MNSIEKYSKIISGTKEIAIGLIYFDDLHKAEVFVDLKTETFYINDMVIFPNTSYFSYDEITNKVLEQLGNKTKATAINITKSEFHKILE